MSQSPYQEHLIAFIDLLGFSEASYDSEDTRTAVLNLLTSLAQARGDYDIKVEQKENGRTVKIKPAISSFSDLIVASYPIESLKENELDFMAVFQFLQKNNISYRNPSFTPRISFKGRNHCWPPIPFPRGCIR